MAEAEMEKVVGEGLNGEEEIVLYTIGCPKCIALERKLKEKNIKYIKNEDVEEMFNMGIEYAPVLAVGGCKMEFNEAIKWIKER